MRQIRWSERLIQEGIIRSWWVFLFALISYAGYEVVTAKQKRLLLDLQTKRAELNSALAAQEAHHANLRLQLASREDPAWVELTLMRCLGVVAEHQTKVYFHSSPNP